MRKRGILWFPPCGVSALFVSPPEVIMGGGYDAVLFMVVA